MAEPPARTRPRRTPRLLRQPARVAAINAEKDKIQTSATKARPVAVPHVRTPVKPLKLGAAFTIGPVRPVGSRGINAMIYGPYGHGKTTFAGSADEVPEMRDVLFINADSGTMSLTNRRTMDFIDINQYDQLARIFEYLTIHCYYRDQLIAGDPEAKVKLLEQERELKSGVVPMAEQTGVPDPARTWFTEQRLRSGKPEDEPYLYRTVILDSISELHKYLIYKFTGVDIGTHPLDEEIERMEEWQSAQELFRLLIRSFRDLPMNCILVSAEEIASRGESDRKKGRKAGQAYPKLAGAIAGDIAGFIDIVGYLMREIEVGGETHRYLYLGAGYEGWISKHRFENLPDLEYVENPTLLSLIELARKDAEYGSSQSRPAEAVKPVAPSRHATRPAASNRSREAHTPAGSHSGGRAGRGRDDRVRRQR